MGLERETFSLFLQQRETFFLDRQTTDKKKLISSMIRWFLIVKTIKIVTISLLVTKFKLYNQHPALG